MTVLRAGVSDDTIEAALGSAGERVIQIRLGAGGCNAAHGNSGRPGSGEVRYGLDAVVTTWDRIPGNAQAAGSLADLSDDGQLGPYIVNVLFVIERG